MAVNAAKEHSAGLMKVRSSVSALVFHENTLALVVKQDSDGLFYSLPCGGQEHGETLREAIRREFLEEVGLPITVGELLFVREYIGKHHEYASTESHIHVTDHIFRGSLQGENKEDASPLERDPDQVGVEWLPVADLDQYRFYPRALIPHIQEIARHGKSSVPVYVGDVN